jgi:hypothetical protein
MDFVVLGHHRLSGDSSRAFLISVLEPNSGLSVPLSRENVLGLLLSFANLLLAPLGFTG